MELERLRLDIEDGIATLTLNHPEVLNAASIEMLESMAIAMDEVEAPENNVRCLVMTGEGRGFCSGANLQGRDEKNSDGPKRRRDGGAVLESHYHPIMRRLRNLNVPYISSVNGVAAGVGMSFALMGDMVLCAKSAYFLQAFRRIGLVPDGGATWLLPRLIGRARAMELSLLGEKLPAETALEWGLVNRVVDDNELPGVTAEIARALADGPYSLGLIRRLYWESTENSHEVQIDLERQFQREAGASYDSQEGVKAFLDKRPAKFEGR